MASSTRSRRSMNPIKVLAAALVVAALIRELRLPQEERTWHGLLGGFVPYDFRPPSWERVRSTFWNPEGPVIVGRVFGVGWTVNVGAAVARARSLAGSPQT
jgi:hypothetical protein